MTRRARVAAHTGDRRLIYKETDGSSFHASRREKLTLSDPTGGVAGVQLRAPRRGQESKILGGSLRAFRMATGRGHVDCNNLNNHRAKRGLSLQHRLQHQLQHQVECYVAPILAPGTGVCKASRLRYSRPPSFYLGAVCDP